MEGTNCTLKRCCTDTPLKDSSVGRFRHTLMNFFIMVCLTAFYLTAAGQNDFRQAANNDGLGLGVVHWINSIVQQNNSKYYEGMSNPQRIIFLNIEGPSTHVAKISHQSVKASNNSHAYDFLTSWGQAVQAAGTYTSSVNLLNTMNDCGAGPGSDPTGFLSACSSVHSGPGSYSLEIDIPDAMGTALGDNVALRVAAYEAAFGNRKIKIWGNAPFVGTGSMVFTGYTGGDLDANYDITWNSTSTNIVIEFAGHLANSVDPFYPGTGYGAARGAGAISGGPYHINLYTLDGASLGSQDNQLKGGDILVIPAASCNLEGPFATCASTNSVAYVATVENAGFNPTYQFSLLNNTANAVISASPPSVPSGTYTGPALINVVPGLGGFTPNGTVEVKFEILQNNVVVSTCTKILTINPLPTANGQALFRCDEGNNQATFNLDALENAINGGSGFPVTFYTNSNQTGPISEANDGAYVTGSTTVYAGVENPTTGCVNVAPITLSVSPLPQCNITGPTTACAGETGLVFSTSVGGQSGYDWTVTGGTITAGGDGNTTVTVTAGAAGTLAVSLTITSNNNCSRTCNTSAIINARVNAGDDGATTICDNSVTAINLFSLIIGEQAGGAWTRLTGTGGTFVAATGTYTPAAGATSSTFQYLLTGTAPCPDDASVATVTIVPQANAGADGATTVCDNSTDAINLFNLITGEQAGGAWTRLTGTGGTFNAGAGTYTPAAGATSSTFQYLITGTQPCPNDASVATVTIVPQANAGADGATTVCDNSSDAINLFNLITGEQAGGAWTRLTGTGGTFNAGVGTYTPAAGATSSTFQYLITGTTPCPNDASVATVTIVPQAYAGTDGATTVCDNSAVEINLFSLITGEQAGGVWTRTGGTGGTFNAGAGTYTPAAGATSSTFQYLVTGTTPCPNDASIATVTIVPQANAGGDGATTVCDNSTDAINLFNLISGEQAGGVWTRIGGTGGTFNAGAGTFVPTGATSSTFQYLITGTTPCPNDASVATVTIVPQAYAGTDGATTVCDNSTDAINLFNLITGEQAGGVWTRTGGTGGTFDAGAGSYIPAAGATSSTFQYLITGTTPCPNDASVATVTINAQVNAGADGGTTVCDNSVAAVNLFDLITGEQAGGAWTRITGTGGTFNAVSGTFVPTGATSSTFQYLVTGTAPCPNDASIATVTTQSVAAPVLGTVQPACPVLTGTITVTSPTAGLTFSLDGGAFVPYPVGGFNGLAPGQHCVRAKNSSDCISAPTCVTIVGTVCVYDGCSPGFWKNHQELWDGVNDNPILAFNMGANPFITTTSFRTFFGLTPQQMQAIGFPVAITMHGAISQGGGACKAFARHAVSTLLSSASGLSIDYPSFPGNITTYAGLYAGIKAALMSGNCSGPLFSALEASSNDDHGNCGRFIRVTSNNARGFLEYVPVITDKIEEIPGSLKVNTFPNPYNDNVTFKIESNISGKGVLEVYNLTGQKLKTVFEGFITAGKGQTIRFNVPVQNRSSLVYRLKVGEKTTTGKVLYIN